MVFYHFYVYYMDGQNWIYDRTCGSENAAEERVTELRVRFDDATYTTEVMNGAFY